MVYGFGAVFTCELSKVGTVGTIIKGKLGFGNMDKLDKFWL